MTQLVSEIREELTGHIIPFWKGLRDDEHGGYIGQVDFDLTRRPEAPRGCILNSRILWFFSEAYLYLKDDSLLGEADHAWQMLIRMTDEARGGVYWSINPDGTVADGTKHTYNQAFAVYALSAYARASGSAEALRRAYDLYDVIQTRCFDGSGYLEAFTADWQPAGNDKLSENGVEAGRTMNTLLHLLEGYTGLYEADGSPRVRESLLWILDALEKRVYNPRLRRQEVFFDLGYRSLIDLHSFGHDIDTSWLADHTLRVLGDDRLTARLRPMLMEMADHTYQAAFSDHGFANECERGRVDQTRHWWVQAEALLGFLNAWQLTGQTRYLEAVRTQWAYIRDVMIDRREGSEWYSLVDEHGVPGGKPIVEIWKCPYHNGRMCLEVLRRCGQEQL